MSSDRNLENLISGYLDDQLTNEERQQVEGLLRDDQVAKDLFETLKSQSLALSSLPKFRLGDDFSERLLNDDRVTNAFSTAGLSASADTNSNAKPVEVNVQSLNYKTAIAAITSLAALVLITLFLPSSNTVSSGVAQFEPDENALMEADDSRQQPTEAVVGKAGVMGGGAKSQLVPGLDQPSDGLEDELSMKRAFKQPSRLGDFDKGDRNQAVELQQSGRFFKKSQTREPSNEKRELAQESASRTRGKLGGSAPVSDSAAGAGLEMNNGQVPSIAGQGNVVEAFENSAAEEADESLKSIEKFAESNKSAPSPGGGGGRGRVANSVDAIREMEQQIADVDLDDQLGREAAVVNNEFRLNTVVQIDYNGGPEMLGELQKSMQRNSIAVALSDESAGNQNSRPVQSSGFGGGGGGRGLGAFPETAKQDLFDKVAEANSFGVPTTQAFMVAATPQQMVQLVEDIKRNASVATIQLTQTADEGLVNRKQIEAAKKFQAEQLALLKENGDSKFQMPEEGKAEEENEDETRDSSQLGLSSRQNNESRRAPTNQGLATQLPLNFGTGRALERLGRKAETSDDDFTVEDDKRKESPQTTIKQPVEKLDAVTSVFENRIRNYLLVVRTQNVPPAKDANSKVQAAPSGKNK